ncbi:MAG TPA: restriction endonuclease [Thermoanaerobaculia bacterium]|nr:restriction endonuclease [Thermoanaerobaculia bacterium]
MAERRVDRIERRLQALGGRARLQALLEEIRHEEKYPDLPYQSLYLAIQSENQRLEELGERTRFITSRDGEERGWVRLREASEFARGSTAGDIEARIHQQNEAVGEEIRAWLQRMDWRTFESTFLTRVLDALGFQDVQITQATRDGGADARVVYQRGVVGARAIVSAKRWTARTVPVDEVRMMRGVKGEEDTAIIVTTGRFSADAQNEARPGQNQRVVYLIDGEHLVDVCKRYQIGVKKVELPGLLVLDPEVTREAPVRDAWEAVEDEADLGDFSSRDVLTIHRLEDEMLGDPERGLSIEEVAELSGYKTNTVRVYLYDGQRRKVLGDAIRGDQKTHSRALALVAGRRETDPSE